MKLCVLGSGSRGNAVLMQSGETRVLIDAGFAPRTMAQRLARIGVDPRSIEAVIVTHEHIDHAKGAAAGAKKWGWDIYATAGTVGACLNLSAAMAHTIIAGQAFSVGDINFKALRTSHDATEPVAVVATGNKNGCRAAVVYDLGVMTESIRRDLVDIDILVIESNHDGEMLRTGPYPPSLKRRIAGREGHLSNRAAGMAASDCAHKGLSHVLLAHLSETNNTPRVATETMISALRKTPFQGVITHCLQDKPSRTISAESSGFTSTRQLTLGL